MPGPGNDEQIGVTEDQPVEFEFKDPENDYTVERGFGAVAPTEPGEDEQIGVTPDKPVHFKVDKDTEYTVHRGVGAAAPTEPGNDDLPDRLCVAGQVGCFNPSVIEEDEMKPDRLCAPGDLNCTERDAGRLPDRLCSDGSWGCFSSDDSKKDRDEGDIMINIFDDWFNSAVGLREITTLSVGCATALVLSL